MIDNLIALLPVHMEFGSVFQHNKEFVIVVRDLQLAGKKPELNEMRDEIDYQFAMDSWNRRGLKVIGTGADFEKAINNAVAYIERNCYSFSE